MNSQKDGFVEEDRPTSEREDEEDEEDEGDQGEDIRPGVHHDSSEESEDDPEEMRKVAEGAQLPFRPVECDPQRWSGH